MDSYTMERKEVVKVAELERVGLRVAHAVYILCVASLAGLRFSGNHEVLRKKWWRVPLLSATRDIPAALVKELDVKELPSGLTILTGWINGGTYELVEETVSEACDQIRAMIARKVKRSDSEILRTMYC